MVGACYLIFSMWYYDITSPNITFYAISVCDMKIASFEKLEKVQKDNTVTCLNLFLFSHSLEPTQVLAPCKFM